MGCIHTSINMLGKIKGSMDGWLHTSHRLMDEMFWALRWKCAMGEYSVECRKMSQESEWAKWHTTTLKLSQLGSKTSQLHNMHKMTNINFIYLLNHPSIYWFMYWNCPKKISIGGLVDYRKGGSVTLGLCPRNQEPVRELPLAPAIFLPNAGFWSVDRCNHSSYCFHIGTVKSHKWPFW